MDTENLQNPDPQATEETPEPNRQDPPTLTDYVSKKAYAGLQTQLNKRNAENAELQKQLDTAQDLLTKAQQTGNERLSAFNDARTEKQALAEQLAQAQQRNLKVDAFKAILTDPQPAVALTPAAAVSLFNLLDDIPAAQDLDATKATILKFAKFGQDLAQTVAKDALTPGYGDGSPNAGLPSTRQDWMKALDGKDPDDPIWEQYRQFEFTAKG